jgi:predicted transcriptional regulator
LGTTATDRVALLSIHQKYAEAILDGSKEVEFRRGRIADDIEVVLVYATQPVGRIVGWFEVEGVVEGTPLGLWRRFQHTGGIDRASYLTYFQAASRAFGIRVRRPVRLATPARLQEIDDDLRPPQSFRYLSTESVSALLAA